MPRGKKKDEAVQLISDEVFEGKVPPYSRELEMNVLGAMLIDNSLIDTALSILKPDYFYDMKHRLICKAIFDLRDRNEPVDLVLLTEELRRREELDLAGGAETLADLASYYTSLDGLISTSNKILEYWVKRDLIRVMYEIREKCFSPSSDTERLLDETQHQILDITNHLQTKDYILIKEEIKDTMEYVESIHERHEKGLTVFGIPSGYDDLDNLTGGFQKSELIIIAGRPSHGKSAFALNIARNAAVEHGKSIGIFSIEMSNRELALRFICLEAKVDISKLKTGRISEEDWSKISHNVPKIASQKVNIAIDDSSPLSLLELRAKARRMKAVNKVDMIIIDYLQLMDVSHLKKIDNRYLEIGYITRSLKQLAKELNIPVVALSQLSRKIEDRSGKEKRPQLSDLRESGSIEQDADVVIFVNRPELYLSQEERERQSFEDYEGKRVIGLAEIIIGKQRNGPIGEVQLTFIGSHARFEKRAKEREPLRTFTETPF